MVEKDRVDGKVALDLDRISRFGFCVEMEAKVRRAGGIAHRRHRAGSSWRRMLEVRAAMTNVMQSLLRRCEGQEVKS